MSETGAGTISLPSNPQTDEAVSSPMSHNSNAVMDLHTTPSGRFQVASQRADVECFKTNAAWEDKSLIGAAISDCAAGRT